MRRPELPVVSFLSIPLLLCSLPSHIRAGSVCTIALIAWLAVMSLIRGVNALIWADNFVVRLEVWCDISTKVTIGFTHAVPAAALCMLRHLEHVASAREVQTTKADKRRRQAFEVCMCFGLPMIFMALHYIVQGHRYDLFENFGCYPSVYFSVPAILVVFAPPLVMSLTTFVYAGLALRHFLKLRVQFAQYLQNSQSAITPGRYFRLMSLAIVEMVWDSGINIYIFWYNTLLGLRPWTTWDDVHSNFSRVGVVPEFFLPPVALAQLIWQWWIIPISCFLFFVFFGFGEEAMSDYRTAFDWIRRNILRQNATFPPPYHSRFILPSHRPQQGTVTVALPPMSRDTLSETKACDELSLKMPESRDHIPSSPRTHSTMLLIPGPCALKETLNTAEYLSDYRSPALPSSERPRSSSPTLIPSPHSTIARPISVYSSRTHNHSLLIDDITQASSLRSIRVLPDIASRPTSYRQSWSTQSEVVVSDNSF